MRFNNWLSSVQNRIRSARKRAASRQPRRIEFSPSRIEHLEPRTMLTVQVTQIMAGLDNELIITTNAGDDISVRAATSTSTVVEVLENGVPVVGIPAIDPATLTRLTVIGDDGNNVINLSAVTGTFFNPNLEIIVDGDDGDDFITGSLDIASTLNGGDGTDVLFGGTQADLLSGGDGQDLLNGGDGNDTLNGGDGGDIINGQVGDDVVNGGSSGDTINGGSGADTLNGQSGTDSITGDTDDDVIDGGSGSDTLDGGLGNDSLSGGSEGDSLLGDLGADTLNGDDGNDSLFGGDDDDLIFGGTGDDSLNGENGNDIVNGNSGNDTALGGADDDTVLGGSGNDLLFGDGDETQANLTGNDRILGHIGNDTIFGGSGADNIDGGRGDDLVTTNDLVAAVNDIQINAEGAAGTTTVVNFTISLSSESEGIITIQYDITSDGTLTGGTATAGADYVSVLGGTATFQPGDTQVQVPVTIIGDDLDEVEETFFITLTGATNVAILDGSGEGRIFDDDATDLTVTPEIDAQVLVNTLVGGNTGIVVTGFNLIAPPALGSAVSTGVFSAGGIAPYGLFGDGVVLSTGDVAAYGSGPDLNPDTSTAFSFSPDFSQDALLDPITGGAEDHFDVTRLDISFDLLPGFDTVFFNTVFGSEEFPEFVPLGFFDGFGIYLNGFAPSDNIAFVGGQPVSIAHPDFAAIPGTELDGVLAPGGNPLLTFQSFIGDGATGNTLTFIIADLIDPIYDATVYISSLGAVLPTGPPSPPAPPVPPSTNQNDTILGGTGNDTLIGSSGDDSIDGQEGNDTLVGGGGMDTILGGEGNDTLVGGSGNDTVDGGQGNNTLGGGTGSDVLILEPFADGTNTSIDTGGADAVEIRGTAGADTFVISQVGGLLRVSTPNASITVSDSVHTVTILGMDGDDTVTMTSINETRPLALQIRLGEGADTFDGQSSLSNRLPIQVLGEGGDDTIAGTLNGDILDGGDGNDVISGDRGEDSIRGGAGNDTLSGDRDDDQLLGGDGADSLFGGTGNDLLQGGNDDDRLNGNSGRDTLEGELGNDTLLGGSGNDLGRGGSGADSIKGQSGNDTLFGGGGSDTIRGEAGNDVINGGDGDDSIRGGVGRDLITGGEGSDAINGEAGNDTLLGDDGDDSMIGGSGADIVLGGDGDDRVSGSGSNADTVAGNEGDDLLLGNQASEIDETFTVADEILAMLIDTQV